MASYTQFGQDRIVISLQGDIRELVVSLGSAAELVLDFPMDGVAVRVEGRDIILECPNGDVIRLVGARGHDGAACIVEGMEALPSLEAFLARFASQVAERRSALPEEDGRSPWDEAGARNVPGRNGQTGDPESENGDSGQPVALVQPDVSGQSRGSGQSGGSGLNTYQTGHETLADRAGSLIPTIDRYDDLGTNWWNGDPAPALRPASPPAPASPPVAATPTIACSHQQGPAYLSPSTVMEGDSYGMRLEISLSRAPASPLAVTLAISGDAVMNDGAVTQPDYANWTSWELVLPGGVVIPATSCMVETAPGQYLLTLPAGTTQAHIRVPLENNDFSQSDRCFTYTLQNTGEYAPSGGLGGTIAIVDECCFQDHNPHWVPPSPEAAAPFAPDYVGPTGPVAHVVIWDGASRSHENGVLEHDTNAVTYRFELYDQQTGAAHAVRQPVDVVLKLTGEHGLVFRDSTEGGGLEDDYILNNIVTAFTTAGARNAAYDGATGKLSFTLPTGWNAGHIEFTANTVQDNRIELGVNGKPEALRIEVESVRGDEAARGQGVHTEVYDAPLVGVTADAAEFFESAGHPDLANTMTFTFTLSSASTQPITLGLDWLTGSSAGLTGDDISYICSGGTPGTNGANGLPGTVTVPAGVATVTITVTARDDKLSEGRETIRVEILPPGDNSYIVGDGSNAQGLDGTASTVLADDTDATRGGLAYCDGPTVQVILVDGSGNPVANQGSVAENQGAVHYKIVLVDGGGNYVAATQQITATLKIEGIDGSVLGFNGAKPANWDMSFSESDANLVMNADGTVTVTIPVGKGGTGDTGLMFKAETNNDAVDETAGNEGVKISVSNVSGNEASAGAALEHSIVETPVVMRIEALSSHYPEQGELGFKLSLTTPFATDTAVRIQLGGGATLNADYLTAGAHTGDTPGGVSYGGSGNVLLVTVPAGASTVNFYLPIVNDSESENNETVVATILPETGASSAPTDKYTVTDGTGKTASTTIVDDTQAWPTGPGIPEEPAGREQPNGPVARIDLKQSNASKDPQDPNFNNDCYAVVEETPEAEGAITYTLSLRNSDSGVLQNAESPVTVTVTVGHIGGILYGHKAGTNNSNDEGDFYFDWTHLQSQLPGFNPATDWNPATGEITITIPAGKNSVDLKVSIVRDQLTETDRNLYNDKGEKTGSLDDEAYSLTIAKVAGNEAVIHDTAGSITTGVVEERGGIQVSIEPVTATGENPALIEGGAKGQFKISLSQKADEPVTVVLEAGGSADGNDFKSPLTVVIPAGRTEASFDLEAFDDYLSEGALGPNGWSGIENFTLTIKDVVGGEAVRNPAQYSFSGTIKDNGNGPVVGISGPATVQESVGDVDYTVRLTGVNQTPCQDMDITIQLKAGTATTVNADPHKVDVFFDEAKIREALEDQGLTVKEINAATGKIVVTVPEGFTGPNGDGTYLFTFPVTINDDRFTENNETFSIVISNVTGSEGTIGSGAATTITDDPATRQGQYDNGLMDGPFLHLSGAEQLGKDGEMYVAESSGTAKYVITLRDGNGNPVTSDEEITVTLVYRKYSAASWAEDTANRPDADPGKDFETHRVTINIPAGVSRHPFEITIGDDSLSESNEWFIVTIDKAVGNEARLPDEEARSAVTVIVDDTQPWPDAAGGVWPDGAPVPPPAGHGVLEGPKVSLAGPDAAYESVNGGALAYRLSLDGQIVQDVAVTLEVTPFDAGGDILTLADLFGQGPDGQAPGGGWTEAGVLAAIQAKNPGMAITGVSFVDSADPDKGFTVTVKIPQTDRAADVKIPIHNDQLTENKETFQVRIAAITGSEAQIDTASDAVKTMLLDDGNGPRAFIHCYDPDEHSFKTNASIVTDLGSTEYDNRNHLVFKLEFTSNVMQAGTKIIVQLTDDNGNPINPAVVHAGNDEDFGDIGGGWTSLGGGLYEATVPVGEKVSYLCVAKPGGGSTYTATIVDTVNCESDIGSPSYATAHVQSSGGEGPWTYITLATTETTVENGIHYVKENDRADFTLHVQGNGISMAHDTDQDGVFDLDLTVNVIIRGFAGEGGSAANPNADIVGANVNAFLDAFKADFAAKNAGYTLSGLSYDTATGRLTFTIDTMGKQYTGGPVANASVDFAFSLPMVSDGLVEGAEYYTVTLGSANKATVNKTPVEMAIVDEHPPTMTLTADNGGFEVTEGGEMVLRLELDHEVTTNFSVYLEHNFTGIPAGEQATTNSDFIPPPTEINFPSGVGSSGWTKIGSNGPWYYEIRVKIPDDATSEVDEKFNIKITGISDKGIAVDNQMPADGVTVTIKDDGNTGPLVSFSESAMTRSEGDTLNFVILLSKPALENVDVYVEVIGLTNPAPGFNALHPGIISGAEATALGLPPGAYLKVTVPAGDIEYKWTLDNFLINDKLSKESLEQLRFDIAKVTGGESRVYDGSDANHGGSAKDTITLTVEDVLDGPSVSVAALKGDHVTGVTEIKEVDAGAAGAEADFVFSLSGGQVAAQDVIITFEVRGNNGSLDNMLDCSGVGITSSILSAERLANGNYKLTIKIPQGSSEAAWSMKELINDGYEEKNHSFSVVITGVKGNEASIGSGTATVAIVDNDHAPDAGAHKIVMLVPSGDQFGSDITIDIDALAYASDLDAGDILGIIAKSGSLRYGSFAIDPLTHKMTYVIDKDNEAIKKLTEGQVISEQRFVYEVTDSWAAGNPSSGYWNASTGTVDITIASGSDMTNTKFDRCFTAGDAEWVFATSRAEVIDARGGADIIRAGGGDDTLIVYADNKGTYYGGGGADGFRLKTVNGATVKLSDYAKDTGSPLTDGMIVGGDDKSGADEDSLDRITLGGDGVTLNASLWGGANMASVEIIDISRSADSSTNYNIVVLGRDFVGEWAASGLSAVAGGIPRVTGRAGDMFSFAPGETWTAGPGPSLLAGYTLYVSNTGEQVYIDDKLFHCFTDPADYNQSGAPGRVAIFGGDGADTISGGLFDDRLVGGDGADTIRSGGGRDAVNAGAGDDHIFIGVSGSADHAVFGSVDGGAGSDTLHLTGAGYTLDLTGLGANTLQNLEIINIATATAGMGNTLIINGDTLKNIGGSTTLYLTGTTDDSYALTGGGWSYDGAGSNASWSAWTNSNGRKLYVSTAMSRSLGGTDSADTLNVHTDKDVVNAKGGNDTINVYNTGFVRIDGGAGIDAMKLVGDGKAFDLDSLAARVEGIEKVNISSATTGNTVTLSGAALTGFTGRNNNDPLVIDGTARDSYILTDADSWTYGGVSGSYHVWTHANGGVIQVSAAMTRNVTGDGAANSLSAYSSADVIDAGAGNDMISIYGAFKEIQGGGGIDTMKLAGDGQSYSLEAFAGKVDGIEAVDISSTLGNMLTISSAGVAGFTNREGGDLTIEGTADDSYALSGAWTYVAESGGYHTWTDGSQTLNVNAAMEHVVTGSAGADQLTVHTATDIVDAGAGNDTITLKIADCSSIDGGAGFDTLVVDLGSGGTLDITLAELHNLERIEVASGGNITLDLAAIKDITGDDNRLEVDCADGQLNLTGSIAGWHANGTDILGGETYYWYTNDEANLLLKFQLESIV